jgi:N-acetylneuraminic acid mutarotase
MFKHYSITPPLHYPRLRDQHYPRAARGLCSTNKLPFWQDRHLVTNKIRSALTGLLFLVCLVTLTSAFNLPDRSPDLSPRLASLSTVTKPARQHDLLTLADRVAYQRAIEEVYSQHRISPKANADVKPPLDKVMSRAQIEKKVEDYLRNSQALEDYWQRPITPDQLQAEMERIASHTKQPAVLREIFAALGNDPFVIAECLARPVLAERLITELYAHDEKFHGELKRRAEAELRTHRSITQMKQTSGMYTEIEWIKGDSANENSTPADAKSVEAVKMNGSEWQESVEKLAKEFGGFRGREAAAFGVRRYSAAFGGTHVSAHSNDASQPYGDIPVGKLSPLQEDDGHYYAVAVMKKGKDRLKLATIAWLKEPLRSWLTKAEAQVPVTMAAVGANYTLPVIGSPSGGCTDDTWTPTSLTNAPGGRTYHTAVWTGSEMIVWGGVDFSGYLNTGGRYDPTTDSWTATNTASAPAGREIHTAVWTGSEMIVWGGYNGTDLNTGGRYNPSGDSWTATSTTNAPAARDSHTAVWTGSEMIVWGGFSNGSYLSTGGRYDPSTDNWAATSTTNAPDARALPTAVWTGSEMIAWGGYNSSSDFNTGGRYNPGTDSWTATSTTNAPDARDSHTAIWTGSEMIVWGGETFNFNLLNTGGRYNPGTDSWIATSIAGAPAARDAHTAVWTSSQMIVWGGFAGSFLNTGGRYNPSTDSWTATSTTGAPAARDFHTAVWTGSQMIIWGGAASGPTYLNTGGRYCAGSQAPMAQSAFSRKTHGAAGTFDVPLPLTGNVGIECRSGGATNDYQMIINFATTVTVGSASVTSGTGSVSSFSVSGSQVTVNLTGVTNVQRITVTLFNVNDGTHMGNVPVSMGVLIGDVNGNAAVNATDVALTKSQVGQAVSSSNFREDVNANGLINSVDVAQVKANVGTALPP